MQLPPSLEEVSKRTRILRDRVLIRPIEYEHPFLATVGVDVQKGVVVGVGYGRRVRKKTAFHQNMEGYGAGRTLYFEDGGETGVILPMRVKPGDVVEFSFRNFEIIDFDRLGFPDVGELLMVWQSAIMTIDPEESAGSSLLWSQSAGYDRHGNFMSGAEAWTRGL